MTRKGSGGMARLENGCNLRGLGGNCLRGLVGANDDVKTNSVPGRRDILTGPFFAQPTYDKKIFVGTNKQISRLFGLINPEEKKEECKDDKRDELSAYHVPTFRHTIIDCKRGGQCQCNNNQTG